MGLGSELKKMIFGEEEGYDYDDDMYDDEEEISVPQSESFRSRRTESNVIPMPAGIASQKERLVVSRPKNVDEAMSIADCLRMNMTCIVNLEGVDIANSQRIADFISGAGYALSCEVERISSSIFVVAPGHVSVTNDSQEEAKSGHILPWISSAFK